MKETTKTAIDWLALIPFGFWPALGVLFEATHHHDDPVPAIWIVLIGANLPFIWASGWWLLRRRDKIPIAHWFIYSVAMHPVRRILFLLGCLALGIVIRRLSR